MKTTHLNTAERKEEVKEGLEERRGRKVRGWREEREGEKEGNSGRV